MKDSQHQFGTLDSHSIRLGSTRERKSIELFAIESGQGKESGGTVVLVEGFFDSVTALAASARGAI